MLAAAGTPVLAQNPPNARRDSLERVLAGQTTADTNRVRTLNRLAAALLPEPAGKAPVLLRESQALAHRLRDRRGEAQALHYQAELALRGGDFAGCQALAQRSLGLARQTGDSLAVAVSAGTCATALLGAGEPEAATRLFTRQLRAARAVGSQREEAAGTLGLGNVAKFTGQDPQALGYYRQAGRLYRSAGPGWLANLCICMASSFANLHQPDSAAFYSQRSLALARRAHEPWLEAQALSVVAKSEFIRGQYVPARDHLRRHIELVEGLGNQAAAAQALKNIANVYNHLGDYAGAVAANERAIALLKQAGDQAGTKAAYDGLAAALFNLDRYEEAFNAQRLSSMYQDSVLKEAGMRSIVEMQTKYETEKKEAQNRLQAAQLRTQEQVIRRRNTQLIAGLLVAGLLAGLAYLLYTRRRLRREVEFAQERQQLTQLRAQAVLDAEEAERRRIGTDLHDGVGQLLTVAKLNLGALGEQLAISTEAQQAMLQNALDVVDESFREVRQISHNLMPNSLIKRGLAQAVRDFLSKVSPDGRLKINIETVGLDRGGRLGPNIENVLFRVIQELVQNIIKHARATEMTLQLVRSPEELTVLVEDNGVGFDPAALGAESSGIGLKNIESRLAFLGGRAEFDSRPGHGTTVTLEVPLAE